MYWYNYGTFYPMKVPPFGDGASGFNMDYWTRSFYQRFTALIDVENLPAFPDQPYTWDKDALKYQLLVMGYAPVFASKTYGIVVQPGTLTGFGLQYQPTGVRITTPYFQLSEPLIIGKDTELIKLTPDYSSVFDIVLKYAAELKEIDLSIKSATRNARVGYAMIAHDDKTARTLKNIGEKIRNGDDIIIDEKLVQKKVNGDMELPWYLIDRDLRNSYILNDLLEARRSMIVDFYREIGVRMLDNKKERMITGEVNAGQAETFIRSEVWAETLKDSTAKVNQHFGTDIRIVINDPDFNMDQEVSANVI